jgi:hypothetical protein
VVYLKGKYLANGSHLGNCGKMLALKIEILKIIILRPLFLGHARDCFFTKIGRLLSLQNSLISPLVKKLKVSVLPR